MRNFCNSYSLNSLIKQPTCFKNPENPSCTDLILTNKPRSFQSTCTKNHLEITSKALDAFSTKYENIILLGNFNVFVDDETMRNFCSSEV